MSYAVRNDGKGWRAVSGPEDISADEYFSETIPAKTNAQLMSEELAGLSAAYNADILGFNLNWLTAARNDGSTEATKKAAIETKVAARNAKLASDRAAVMIKYA